MEQKAKGMEVGGGGRQGERAGGGLRANDVDEMLLSGEHVTRPRRIEINTFASWISASSSFPLLSFLSPVAPRLTPRPIVFARDGSFFL